MLVQSMKHAMVLVQKHSTPWCSFETREKGGMTCSAMYLCQRVYWYLELQNLTYYAAGVKECEVAEAKVLTVNTGNGCVLYVFR